MFPFEISSRFRNSSSPLNLLRKIISTELESGKKASLRKLLTSQKIRKLRRKTKKLIVIGNLWKNV